MVCFFVEFADILSVIMDHAEIDTPCVEAEPYTFGKISKTTQNLKVIPTTFFPCVQEVLEWGIVDSISGLQHLLKCYTHIGLSSQQISERSHIFDLNLCKVRQFKKDLNFN